MQQERVSQSSDGQRRLADVEALPTLTVPTADLIVNEDIRTSGVDPSHMRLLANCATDLPPILVQKKTMRVIDGMHRLRAAQARGDRHIRVVLLEVDDENAYLHGVTANVTHGLPLSMHDRKTAARRIIRIRPDWSDRAIGKAAGLSDKTVAALRRHPTADAVQPTRRVGMDGHARPVDGTEERNAARQLLIANPNASLRDIARRVGTSPGTVRRVRNALNSLNGKGSVSAEVQAPSAKDTHGETDPTGKDLAGAGPVPLKPRSYRKNKLKANADVILANLRQDPSLKYRINGRRLLQLLLNTPTHALNREFVTDIPSRWFPSIATLARIYAQEWLEFAELLETSAEYTEWKADGSG